MILRALIVILGINAGMFGFLSNAKACMSYGEVVSPCPTETDFLKGVRSIKVEMRKVHKRKPVWNPNSITHTSVAVIVAHPIGCPWRAFCGCGAVQRLKHAWGVILKRPRDLWLAANWFRFPRAVPAPGMVAVRRHHVFVLESHLGGDTWLAFDANSGGHRTRIHARSIAGYVIVDPRA